MASSMHQVSFKVYRRIKHGKIQIKFEFGGHLQNLTELWPVFDFGFSRSSSWNSSFV